MTLVLRLIRQSRWDSPAKLDWLAEGEIPADPLADFANTSDNRLSVWLIDDDKKVLHDVLTALAASREKADILDYVLFTEKHLKATAIAVDEKRGNTPLEHVNECHRVLNCLSAAKVLELTTRVWHEHREIKRIDARRVVQLVGEAVRGRQILLERLRPKLRDDVRYYLGNGPRGPNAPK